jgi:hypothetical protein
MKMERVSLQSKHGVIKPFITANKKKKTESKNKDAPRKIQSI